MEEAMMGCVPGTFAPVGHLKAADYQADQWLTLIALLFAMLAAATSC